MAIVLLAKELRLGVVVVSPSLCVSINQAKIVSHLAENGLRLWLPNAGVSGAEAAAPPKKGERRASARLRSQRISQEG